LKKLYEVVVTNTVGEVWQIKAENEDEARDNYSDGELVREETIICDVEQVCDLYKSYEIQRN